MEMNDICMQHRPRILLFVSHYLPGYKAGGPLRTISNMVEQLGHEFDFWIVTRDRDQGDVGAYENIAVDQWVTVNNAHVYYCSPKQQCLSALIAVINETPHDILYLNSVFDRSFTIKPLVARFLGKLSHKPTLLAPRGEFSEGALKLKRRKKRVYLLVSKFMGLYKNITWHASSEHEMKDIQRIFPKALPDILIALDLPAEIGFSAMDVKHPTAEDYSTGELRIVFLSRISPMKNLDFALHVLSIVKSNIIFDIYGPLEDPHYWEKCQKLIATLPSNVAVTYRGIVIPDDVSATFFAYDLFLFPTHGENYGHVIAESLRVGTPVLLSDKTPWRDLSDDGLGWDISLDDTEKFVEIIESCASKNQETRTRDRVHIQEKIIERLTESAVLEANRQLFYKRTSK